MTLAPPIIAAVNRYGGLVDQLAHHDYGISGAALLAKLVQGESGGQANQTSSAGAEGYTQFMPASRQTAIQKYGIDPWAGPDQAVHAAALHLLGDINGSKGLAGYNPGDSSYTGYILDQHVGDVHTGAPPAGAGPAGAPPGSAPGPVTLTQQLPAQNPAGGFDAGSTPDLGWLLSLLTTSRRPAASAGVQVPAPAFSAQKYLPSAGTSPQLPAAPVIQDNSVQAVLDAIRTPGQELPQSQPQQGGASISATTSPAPGGAAVSSRAGLAHFDGKPVAAWIAPALAYARAHGWNGTVTSGYRTYAQQQQIYASGRRPAAKPGTSNHEMTAYPGGAVDVTNAQQLSGILQGSPYAGKLVWAGGKDPVHFSHPHGGGY